jgi:protein TonB
LAWGNKAMRAIVAVALIVASGIASCAEPPDTFAIKPHISGPLRTVRAPTAADIRNVYPPEAKMRGMAGMVMLDCVLNAEGALTACGVEYETPAGQGFGAAALRAAPAFREAADTPGAPLAGWRVRVPVNFRVD